MLPAQRIHAPDLMKIVIYTNSNQFSSGISVDVNSKHTTFRFPAIVMKHVTCINFGTSCDLFGFIIHPTYLVCFPTILNRSYVLHDLLLSIGSEWAERIFGRPELRWQVENHIVKSSMINNRRMRLTSVKN